MNDFNVSDAAVEQIKIVQGQAEQEGIPLRVAVKGGGCSGFTYSLRFDEKSDSDMLFTFDDIEIIVDPRSFMYLKGVTIDYESGLMGSGFSFNNPNATRTCGCNKSFGV